MNPKAQIFGEPERKSTFFFDDPPPKKAQKRSKTPPKKSNGKSKKTEDKKEGKDPTEQDIASKKAEKMAEDPFLTESEMRNMDGSTKEKEQKAQNGSDEGEKESSEESQEENQKKQLENLAERAEKILFHATTIFPFDFFGSTVTIDANKVNIRIKTFFFTETVTSIILKEIMDVRVQATLFFGKLVIDYGPHPLKIKTVFLPNLKKKDALKAKEIIEGILVAYRGENIDTTKLPPEETIGEIEEIGKAEEVD